MKVIDIMQKHVEYVEASTPLDAVSEIIFGQNINGVPVVKNKKVIGFVTERDILAKFYPSIEEYMEDIVHNQNFEEMEKEISQILSIPVEKVMSKNVTTITADTPVLKAQSLMFVKKIGRLPVVDEKKRLIGMVTKRDIFNAVVGDRLPLSMEEKFYDWLAYQYDIRIDWRKRLAAEIPDLVELFEKEKVKTVVDVASSTGEHAIALAREGFTMYGFESSTLMHKIAKEKVAELSKSLQAKIHITQGSYSKMNDLIPGSVDAAMFMGNALAHVAVTDPQVLSEAAKLLRQKNGIMIFQMTNFDKILSSSDGLQDFSIRTEKDGNKKHIFMSYYSIGENKELMFNLVVFDFRGNKWVMRGINHAPIMYVDKKEISDMLSKVGFKKIKFYGASLYDSLFSEKFSQESSDLMIVVAKR